MRIVFVQESGGTAPLERVFSGSNIRVGRDPNQCHLIFDHTQWPMVSRRHAEFSETDGRCLLVDSNSSLGTYVNGNRIDHPFEVHQGAKIQFGAQGPTVVVKTLELNAPNFANFSQSLNANGDSVAQDDGASTLVDAEPPPRSTGRTSSFSSYLEFQRPGETRLQQVRLDKDIVRLGREPEMEVAFEAAAAVVSRKHAEIRRSDRGYVLADLNSFNGTLLNGQRITQPAALNDGDEIQLGPGGPTLRFVETGTSGSTKPPGEGTEKMPSGLMPSISLGTMVITPGSGGLAPVGRGAGVAGSTQHQLLHEVQFQGQSEVTVGRAADNVIRLDGLQISNHHARVLNSDGTIQIEDTNSTNGVYVNGERISGRRPIRPEDIVQIGPFVLQAHPQRGIAIYDTRSKTRIDVIDIVKEVQNRSGSGKIRLLDDVDLTILPNEFVGLLGPSGAGKSTLMDSMNGMRPATAGHVLINNLNLYQHIDSLKQSIGYVPQDDIIHRELTVYRTLYYVARLRLSRDVSKQEIDQIVNEVMDVTGLAERRDVPVGQLSGGQRKRVSIAVELITKPSVIFLDEPTSGLDPATEEKIMKLFRQIAESGRTVILTTHAMENVKLFDKIVVMMRGKLVFYGTPQEALEHVRADSFKDLYDKLEAPIAARLRNLPPLPIDAPKAQKAEFKRQKEQVAEAVAEEWKLKFQQTEIYQRNVVRPLAGLKGGLPPAPPTKRQTTVTDTVRQWATLARRYVEVLGRDKLNLFILLAQAPIIAILTYLVVGEKAPRDFPFFMLALVAVWFGASVSAREIIRERAVYTRERMVNLGLLPYVGSKLFVLSWIVGLQCLLLFGTLKFFDLVGLMKLPGYLVGIPQFVVLLLTGVVGIAMGLFVSAVVKTSEMATSLVPLILIPQILFSGLVGVPQGISKVVGLTMPATWSFDEIKRLAPVDTLREEGSDSDGPNKGQGLYKHIEDVNEKNIAKARKDFDRYREDAEQGSKQFESDMKDYTGNLSSNPYAKQPEVPKLGNPPSIPDAQKVPADLSNYVDFLHPWGNIVLNPLVLIIMFFGLVIATVLALRTQDIG